MQFANSSKDEQTSQYEIVGVRIIYEAVIRGRLILTLENVEQLGKLKYPHCACGFVHLHLGFGKQGKF